MSERVDDLYGLPPGEFTAARNDLAAALKQEGEAERAAKVRALKKPSVSAWATNQLARRHPEQLRSLLEAGERLRRSQEEVLRGADPAEMREAATQRRDAVTALLERAADILEEAGSSPGSHIERVRSNLMAAVSDEARGLLERGCLTSDLSAGDDFGFGGMVPSESDATVESPRRRAAARKKAEQLRRQADDAEALARELAEEAARAEQAATQARMRASDARHAAHQARAKADQARREL